MCSILALAPPFVLASLLPICFTALLVRAGRPWHAPTRSFWLLQTALIHGAAILIGVSGAIQASSLTTTLGRSPECDWTGPVNAAFYVHWLGLVFLYVYLLLVAVVGLPTIRLRHRFQPDPPNHAGTGQKGRIKVPTLTAPVWLVFLDLGCAIVATVLLTAAAILSLLALLLASTTPTLLVASTSASLGYEIAILSSIACTVLRRRFKKLPKHRIKHHAKPEDVSIRPADPVRTRDSEVTLLACSQVLGIVAASVFLVTARSPHPELGTGAEIESIVWSVLVVLRLAVLLARSGREHVDELRLAPEPPQWPDLISLSPSTTVPPRLSLNLYPSPRTASTLTRHNLGSPCGSGRYVLVSRPLRRSGPFPEHPYATLFSGHRRALSSPLALPVFSRPQTRPRLRGESTLSCFNWSDALHSVDPAEPGVVPEFGSWEDDVQRQWSGQAAARRTVPAWLASTPQPRPLQPRRCDSAPPVLPSEGASSRHASTTDRTLEVLASRSSVAVGPPNVVVLGEDSEIARLHRQLSFEASQSLAASFAADAGGNPSIIGSTASASHEVCPSTSPAAESTTWTPRSRSFGRSSQTSSSAAPASTPSPSQSRLAAPSLSSLRSVSSSSVQLLRLRNVISPSSFFRGAARRVSEESFVCVGPPTAHDYSEDTLLALGSPARPSTDMAHRYSPQKLDQGHRYKDEGAVAVSKYMDGPHLRRPAGPRERSSTAEVVTSPKLVPASSSGIWQAGPSTSPTSLALEADGQAV